MTQALDIAIIELADRMESVTQRILNKETTEPYVIVALEEVFAAGEWLLSDVGDEKATARQMSKLKLRIAALRQAAELLRGEPK